jgi:hypothetical protein
MEHIARQAPGTDPKRVEMFFEVVLDDFFV